jgi:hypothetical protein
MGLFDFIFHYGEKFTKDEIKILDRNFNSISAYTKKKYKFFLRKISSDLNGDPDVGINYHQITYRHQDTGTDESDPKFEYYINCRRYLIRNKRDYDHFVTFFENIWEGKNAPKIIIPKIKDFPTPVLMVGYMGNGFAVALQYNYDSGIDRSLENSDLTDDCIKKIESLTIKYLKKLL